MAADFDEVQFPTDISKGSSGGPERNTTVVTLGSGFEERNALWADSRRKYDASLGIRDIDDVHDVLAFFEARMGRLRGFRWKDWADYKSCKPRQTPSSIDQQLGVGNGTNKAFQLVKTYVSGGQTYTRVIRKPVEGTVVVSVDSVPQPSGWTVDTTTGVVTFTVAPANGVNVKAGFEFDVPVRFAEDYLPVSVEVYSAGTVPQLDILEIKQ